MFESSIISQSYTYTIFTHPHRRKKKKSALNKDGSWKDGPPIPIVRKIKDYLIQIGWDFE